MWCGVAQKLPGLSECPENRVRLILFSTMTSGRDQRWLAIATTTVFAVSLLVGVRAASGVMLHYDIACFLLHAEAVDSGLRAYVDFFEINTPANIWLPYIAVKLSQVLPYYRADLLMALLVAFVVVCTAFTILLIWQRLAADFPITMIVAATAVPYIYFCFPGFDFGQREPTFFAAMGPYATIVVGRYLGKHPGRASAIGAGILSALGAAQKPHFMILAGAIVFADLCLRHGKLRQLGTEAYTLSASLVLYVLLIVIVHTDYVTVMLPIAAKTYVPMAQPLDVATGRLGLKRVALFGAPIVALLGFALWRRRTSAAIWPVAVLWCVAVFGTLGIYFGQSFGFRYQQLIFMPLLIVTCALALAAAADDIARSVLTQARTSAMFASTASCALLCLAASLFVAHALDTLDPGTTRQDVENDHIVRYFRDYPPGTPILWLGTNLPPWSPMYAYTNVRPTGRYATLLALRKVVDELDEARAKGRPVEPAIADIEQKLRRYVLLSLESEPKPEFVVVDVSKTVRWFETYGKPFSLVSFFSEQPAFAREWTHYRKVADMPSMGFKVDIYRRNKDAGQ